MKKATIKKPREVATGSLLFRNLIRTCYLEELFWIVNLPKSKILFAKIEFCLLIFCKSFENRTRHRLFHNSYLQNIFSCYCKHTGSISATISSSCKHNVVIFISESTFSIVVLKFLFSFISFIFFCKTFFLRKYELKFGLLWIKIKPRDKPCVFSHFFYRFSRNSIIHELKIYFSESFINSMSFSQYLSMFQCLF